MLFIHQIQTKDVIQNGGSPILDHFYQGSLVKALQSVYPEHNWQVWKFSHSKQPKNNNNNNASKPKKNGNIPSPFSSPSPWEELANVKTFLDDVSTQLNLKSKEDWYNVQPSDITSNKGGGSSLLQYFGGSLCSALQAAYPNVQWQPERFATLTNITYNNNNIENHSTNPIANTISQQDIFDSLCIFPQMSNDINSNNNNNNTSNNDTTSFWLVIIYLLSSGI